MTNGILPLPENFPGLQAKDINGKTYSLKDFKGKYLYIDMWATWCGPCQKRNTLFDRTGKENGREKHHLPRSFQPTRIRQHGKKQSNRENSPAFNFCLGEEVNSNGIIISTASLISFLLIRMARLSTPKQSALLPQTPKRF